MRPLRYFWWLEFRVCLDPRPMRKKRVVAQGCGLGAPSLRFPVNPSGQELMQLAGVETEDFDIKKMTLNSVFAMQLHRYPDEVNELVVTAQNELKIESELAKIDSTWRNMPLGLKAYKGEPNNPRGYVLLPNEEMKPDLGRPCPHAPVHELLEVCREAPRYHQALGEEPLGGQ